MTKTQSIRQIRVSGDSFIIAFSYNAELVNSLKGTIPAQSRSYDFADKVWIVEQDAAFAMEGWGRSNSFEFSAEALSLLAKVSNENIQQTSNDIVGETIIDLLPDNKFVIKFIYNASLVNATKAIPGREFNSSEKQWEVPVKSAREIREFALQYNFTITDKAQALLSNVLGDVEVKETQGLKKTLFAPFQPAGVRFQVTKKRSILADEMGLGKTVQTIASIMETQCFPCIILCPKKLVLNWRNEWKAWTDKRIHVVGEKSYGSGLYGKRNGQKIANSLATADVYIVNFDGMNKITHAAHVFKSVVIDEAHELRNPNTNRTKNAFLITKDKEYIFALTGTPVVNSPADLYTILKLIGRSNQFGGDANFKLQYVDTQKSKKYGPGKMKELNQRLNEICYLKREKKLVMKDLPPKIRQEIFVPLTNRANYDIAMRDLATYLRSIKHKTEKEINKTIRNESLTKIMYLKQLSALGKIQAGIELAETIIEGGEKVVLFAHHRVIIDELLHHFKDSNAVAIHGEIPQMEVNANVYKFQNDPACKVIICSIKAAGVGLTLTAASKVIFFELGWTPSEMEQAEDRCHRIGTVDTVNCYYLLGEDTIDQKINGIIKRKRGIANAVAGVTTTIETSVYDDLITYLTQSY